MAKLIGEWKMELKNLEIFETFSIDNIPNNDFPLKTWTSGTTRASEQQWVMEKEIYEIKF